jgi:peptide/nickel transport system permease protein
MLRFTLRRALVAVLVALTVSLVAFLMLRLTGDLATAIGGESARGDDIERIRKNLGLDRPVLAQYWDWFRAALTGDFGKSFYYPATVWDLLIERLPTTLTLSCAGLLISLVIGIPLGVVASLRPNTWVDRIAMSIAVLGQAMPTFWFGLLMIILFGLILRWLPISGDGTWAHFVLPSFVLGYYATPAIMRLTRSGMLEVLSADYIRTAYSKGLPDRVVLFKHALRNAVIPVVALASVQFGQMLSGSVVIETVFAMQGIGQLAWQSISRQDFPVVQAVLLLVSMFYVWLNFAADLINAWLDPRIRVG